jgi:hypothetical protein
VAARSAPTCHALVAAVRRSRVVAPDETGWKVSGRLAASLTPPSRLQQRAHQGQAVARGAIQLRVNLLIADTAAPTA